MRWLGRLRPGGRSPRQQVADALQLARAGQPDDAIAAIAGPYPEALTYLEALGGPDETAWLRLDARLQFRAGQMREAAATIERSLSLEEDAASWNLLGRIRVWLRDRRSDEAFARAARLDPEHYAKPYRVGRDRFVALADRALAKIPAAFHERLANTMIVVDDLPTLESVREGEDPDLLGLYEGATVLEHGLPERIVLYQRNHENISASLGELREQIDETMAHEIGHHFGMDEDELPY
ncbi:MAG TPA: metallopeptidase family protein [Candidatus Limnocylindrales bacterium]|nr:metallopeptidase family protein [Candidatus Limnocylindrales bacterium]